MKMIRIKTVMFNVDHISAFESCNAEPDDPEDTWDLFVWTTGCSWADPFEFNYASKQELGEALQYLIGNLVEP